MQDSDASFDRLLDEVIQDHRSHSISSYSIPSTTEAEELNSSLEEYFSQSEQGTDIDHDPLAAKHLRQGNIVQRHNADAASKIAQGSVSGSELSRSRPMSPNSAFTIRDSETDITEWDSIRSDFEDQAQRLSPARSLTQDAARISEKAFKFPTYPAAPPAYSEIDVIPTKRESDAHSVATLHSISSHHGSTVSVDWSQEDRKVGRNFIQSALRRARLAVHFEKAGDLDQAVQFYQRVCDQLAPVASSGLDDKEFETLRKIVRAIFLKILFSTLEESY